MASPADGTRDSYDRVAAEYAARFTDELDHKPLDRALLRCFAEEVGGAGVAADIGCGPGQTSRYLTGLGLDVLGIDVSPGMVDQARRLNPAIRFQTGDMRALDVDHGAWAGIVAFYSIIHLPAGEVPCALGEFHRALRPGGRLLLAYHVGEEVRHLDEWWGTAVDVDFHFFATETLEGQLRETGFEVTARLEREPYRPHEVETRRGYLMARKSTRPG